MAEPFDVAVVGSGPSGALAAAKLVHAGLRVLVLDVGNDDAHYRPLIPDVPFSTIRRTDLQQRRYFLGDRLEGIPAEGVRVGAQLTPPRQFVTHDTDRFLPTRGDRFEPMQSLALGGLGAAWGAACFTYSPAELARIGIGEPGFERFYSEVARLIGVSGSSVDDASHQCFAGVEGVLPPLELDSVSRAILETYSAHREAQWARGLVLGRTPLAVLSRDHAGRHANPYFDMDYWSESRRSVFRPRYLIEALEKEPGFRLERGMLVCEFESDAEGATLRCRDVASGAKRSHRARRIVLCAGAINSARIALHSLGLGGVPVPILCNPYVYLPSLALRMLGRAADDRRHSLSQLVAIFAPEDDPDDVVSAQFYGYRSLLLFKLVKEIPLPPWAGLLVARLLLNSLVVIGLHHSDTWHAGKTMQIVTGSKGDALPAACFEYAPSADAEARRRRREKALIRLLMRLRVVPYARISPGAASSIHYAGTLPIRDTAEQPFTTRPDGRLWAAPHVYVGDSAGWRFLPAKGLTFTIMANALRVAGHVLADLGAAR